MSEQPHYGQPYQQPYQQPYPYQQPPGQQPYPQVPPQQGYQGPPPVAYQQPPYQNPYPPQQSYPQQQYGGPTNPQAPPQVPSPFPGPDRAQAGPKPKKKRSRWAIFFIVLFSPLIAIAFVVYAFYWVLCWLLTPVALVVHFALCGLGLIWFSLVKTMASGRSKYRLFQPVYPQFPPFWTGRYWLRLNHRVRSTFEGLAAIGELLNW